MADSTGTSEFVVAANKFRVKKPDGTDGISWNGTASRLDVSGDIYANNLYGTGIVTTTNVATNAITNSAATEAATGDISVSITVSAGSRVLIWVSYSPSNITVGGGVYLTRDGSTLYTEWYADSTPGTVAVMAIDYPSAGTHTYSLFSEFPWPRYLVNPKLMILEAKR